MTIIDNKDINDELALSILKSGMPDLNELQYKAVERGIYYLMKYGIFECGMEQNETRY